MKKYTYTVTSLGRECGPEFDTYSQAKARRNELDAEDMKKCRSRFGCAVKHTDGDSAQVWIGPANGSALDSSYAIVELK
mgnify:FL=1